MNQVILMGRLTRDPEIKETTQCKIASYSLAVDRRKTAPDGSREVDFINIKAFSKGADFAQNYLHKGTKILVRGRISMNKYTNKDGVQVTVFEVVAEEQEFCESKAASEAHAVQTGTQPANEFVPIPDNLDDEGLPFK